MPRQYGLVAKGNHWFPQRKHWSINAIEHSAHNVSRYIYDFAACIGRCMCGCMHAVLCLQFCMNSVEWESQKIREELSCCRTKCAFELQTAIHVHPRSSGKLRLWLAILKHQAKLMQQMPRRYGLVAEGNLWFPQCYWAQCTQRFSIHFWLCCMHWPLHVCMHACSCLFAILYGSS
jgi:hypothetical protein